jgi:hypothetical protein
MLRGPKTPIICNIQDMSLCDAVTKPFVLKAIEEKGRFAQAWYEIQNRARELNMTTQSLSNSLLRQPVQVFWQLWDANSKR